MRCGTCLKEPFVEAARLLQFYPAEVRERLYWPCPAQSSTLALGLLLVAQQLKLRERLGRPCLFNMNMKVGL